MTEEAKHTKAPELRRYGIQTWVEEFKGYLMGNKRSHLSLRDPRPTADEDTLDELASQGAKLRRYEEEIKESQKEWDERNDIVRSKLLECTIDPDNSEARQLVFEGIKNDKTAIEILEILIKRFDYTDTRVINAAIKKFTSMKAASGEKATSFITRLKEQQEQLRQKGKTFDDGELVGRLLEGLKDNPTYSMNIAALETVKNLTFKDAIEQLQTKDEADAAAGVTTETVAVAYSTTPTAPAESNKREQPMTCQICKKIGHSAIYCRFRNKKAKESNRRKEGETTGTRRRT